MDHHLMCSKKGLSSISPSKRQGRQSWRQISTCLSAKKMDEGEPELLTDQRAVVEKLAWCKLCLQWVKEHEAEMLFCRTRWCRGWVLLEMINNGRTSENSE